MRIKLFRSAMLAGCLALIASAYSSRVLAQQKAPQEIKFSSKAYKEVLATAKAAHKKVFIDAYATWCAPCKELRKHTFNDPKAAAYFNKNFVNFTIDVEKGEGIALAKTWQVDGLPTLLIVDEKGQVLANHVGFVDGDGLIQFAKEATENIQSKGSKPASKR
ncbi:thioredoxin family protein [Chitinophaga pinensis]|uniref:Thioredoxin domain protein n=1 Tax=Chitinophaga pinensis (strain ATCC 43595 / DSM 2588 / LMG 13176 / NBRC 15968 / NCIMB 11800 / UQM 2034) TaxID=485918 RepID=A0A979GC74_CHIPD|nr:thioredoxin domain-containing protein [Chitinophaga pinensis]ACU64517.1 thioredoxin domain protein [Chitinophaga pinensis DSM 2588]